ncbi:MAG: excinuclease ABC subunit UvrC [Eubacterium sp.]|nr:excinuclease ABC subunit UvrC [Eubacterium sp.]
MFDIQENLKKLPETPGVYIHKDSLGQVIYVGKAVSLRNRVRQYFQASYQNTNPKIKALAKNIAEFEYINCSTEMEALILECNLIKKYQPRYNVLLKDDKTYPYIMVTTSEEFPRVVKTRTIKKDGNKYFGPYSDVGAVNDTVDLLAEIYSLKRCSYTSFPPGFRPCLNYHIRTCQGICMGQADKADYDAKIDEIIEFLSGRGHALIKGLTEKMKKASEELRFEDAAVYRDHIASLRALEATQRVTMINDSDLDILLLVKNENDDFVVLFPVRDGKLSGRETFPIHADPSDTDSQILTEFIKQYYSQWAQVPHEILVETEPDELELLEEFLGKDRHKVRITVPKKGQKKALLDLTRHDILEMKKSIEERAQSRREREQAVLAEMSYVLEQAGIKEHGTPVRVESYDISNTNGVDSVGAMVVFEGLTKVKKDYRRYKIKTVDGPDDYASLQEVLYRRYKRAVDQAPGYIRFPDAILMDGGLGQVHAAKKVLDAMKVDVPVFGMAKDDKHRTRALVFTDGREIDLKDRQVLFSYLGTVQEEVHRFAIDYHHTLHRATSTKSMLDDIEGVGEKRRNELLYHFRTIEAIRSATADQIAEVPGMTSDVAEKVYEYFHKKS